VRACVCDREREAIERERTHCSVASAPPARAELCSAVSSRAPVAFTCVRVPVISRCDAQVNAVLHCETTGTRTPKSMELLDSCRGHRSRPAPPSHSPGFHAPGSGFRVSGFGSGFRVAGFGFRGSGQRRLVPRPRRIHLRESVGSVLNNSGQFGNSGLIDYPN